MLLHNSKLLIHTSITVPHLKRLLPYDLLRVAVWFVCGIAIVGNIFVLYTRFKNKEQRNRVQFFMITDLSISDFFMGVYLLSLLSVDMYYTTYFPSHSESWRRSMLCRVAGALSVLSSEASAFFITLITIDRFLGVKYTFSKLRLRTKSVRIAVCLLWLVALSVSILVLILSQSDSEVYAISEICVGLPFSRRQLHTVEKSTKYLYFDSLFTTIEQKYKYTDKGSQVGMYFSIVLFTGLNMACFFIVAYCYLAIFIFAKQTANKSARSS